MKTLQTIDKFKEQLFKSLDNSKNTFSHIGIQERLDKAFERLNNYSIPNKKHEDWKYSNIGKWVNSKYKVERSNNDFDIESYKIPGLDANILVFVNGFFRDDLSDVKHIQKGLIIQNFTESCDLFSSDINSHFAKYTEDNFFNDLNTLYHGNGLFLKVDDNTLAEHTVQIVNIQTGNGVISQPRNLFLIGENSELNIVETHVEVDASNCLTNQVSEFIIGKNSRLNYVLSQSGKDNALIHTNRFVQHDHSRLVSNVFTLSKEFIRNNHIVSISGIGTETELNGTFMPKGDEQVDNHTLLDHQNVNGYSKELYKGILFKDSNAIFNGKIFVNQKAQKTNAFLNNYNILLDDNAIMESKPELEIYADDVKCSHGSATGDIDSEALFYLQSRGIGKDSARALLMHSFLGEVLEKVANENVREAIGNKINNRLSEINI